MKNEQKNNNKRLNKQMKGENNLYGPGGFGKIAILANKSDR